MAATRAAELTVAYKTLTDPATRAEYDASIAAGLPPPHMPPPAPEPVPDPADEASPFEPPTIDEIKTPPPRAGSGRFAAERADRDVILRRAIAERVHATVETLYGKVETPDGARLRSRHGAGGEAALPRLAAAARAGAGRERRRRRRGHRGVERRVAGPRARRQVAGRGAAVSRGTSRRPTSCRRRGTPCAASASRPTRPKSSPSWSWTSPTGRAGCRPTRRRWSGSWPTKSVLTGPAGLRRDTSAGAVAP